MKLVRKILPIASLPIVAAAPFAATSCSNVYLDLLSKQFIPTDETPLASTEMAASEAETAYYEYFKDHKDQLGPDANWGSSIYARIAHPLLFPLSEFQTLLCHVYSFNVAKDDVKSTHRLSYNFRTQFQLKDKTDQSSSGTSYSINTYDITFDFQNIECFPWYNGKCTDVDGKVYHTWSLCPNKFNIERGRWYQELEGDERIKFEIKAVYKGYSENGAQNYVKEINESAIIDEQHKYVPELNETFTEMMLITPYYLSNVTPRMWLTKGEEANPSNITLSDSKYTATANFDFGELTQKLANTKVKLSLDPTSYVYSPTKSGAKISSITVDKEIDITDESVPATITFNFEKKPYIGDTVYYCIIADHYETERSTDYDWREWFVVSSTYTGEE